MMTTITAILMILELMILEVWVNVLQGMGVQHGGRWKAMPLAYNCLNPKPYNPYKPKTPEPLNPQNPKTPKPQKP